MTEILAALLIFAGFCVSAVCIYLVGKYMFGPARYHDEDKVMDFLPISGSRDYRKKIAKALVRHGKPHRTHTKVVRVEPPSRTLQELEAASKQVAPSANVAPIKKASK